jgi:tripartite-type tricarboxylate transporter receptor subunit TctC
MKRIARAVLFTTAVGLTAAAFAQQPDYPGKPIRLVVPAQPGTSLDVLGRSITDFLAKRFNQSAYVENKAGAGGVLGANEVKTAAPDGYTLLFSYDAMVNYPLFIKDNTFVLSRDLAPISLVAGFPLLLLATSTMPAKTLPEIVAYAKANPGKVNFGMIPNTGAQLLGIQFGRQAAINVTLVPYSTSVLMMAGALSGDIQIVPSEYAGAAEGLRSGKLRAFGVAASNGRIKQDPSIATLKEQGLDIVSEVWYGVFAPKATPTAVIGSLGAALVDFAKQPDMIDRASKLGLDMVGSTPAEFAKRIADDTASRAEAARAGGIQPK